MGSSAVPPGLGVSLLRLAVSVCMVLGASMNVEGGARAAVCSCLAWGSSPGTCLVVEPGWWQEPNADMGAICVVVACYKRLCGGGASRLCVQMWEVTTSACMAMKTKTTVGAGQSRLVASLHAMAEAILFCTIAVKYKNAQHI